MNEKNQRLQKNILLTKKNDKIMKKDEWQPAKSFEEAVQIVKRYPITADMTYEERLSQLKARFGL